MSVKPKRLVNSYEERMLEFLQTCINENYRIHPQVSLCQFCELGIGLDIKLRNFFFSSSVDALIINKDYKPYLLTLAGVPLLYSRIKDCGLLHLYSENEQVIFNLFTGENRENAKTLIRNYCEPSNFANLRAIA